MGLLNAFYPSIELAYWAEFWIIVSIFFTIGILCLFFIKTRWLKHTLGWFFIILSLPVTLLIYTIPYSLGKSDLTQENMLAVVKDEIKKNNVKLVKYIPYFMLDMHRPGNKYSFKTYKDCGDFCIGLLENNYTTNFYEDYFANIKGNATAERNKVYRVIYGAEYPIIKSETVSKEIYYKIFDYTECYRVKTTNKWKPQFGYNNLYNICHFNSDLMSIKGSLEYEDAFFKPFALHYQNYFEGIDYLNWFEIYPILTPKTAIKKVP